jgi:hypothetical protein
MGCEEKGEPGGQKSIDRDLPQARKDGEKYGHSTSW